MNSALRRAASTGLLLRSLRTGYRYSICISSVLYAELYDDAVPEPHHRVRMR